METDRVVIWTEPLPHAAMVSLWWQWERPGVQVITIPGLLMPPSDAARFMRKLLLIPSAVGDESKVTIFLV